MIRYNGYHHRELSDEEEAVVKQAILSGDEDSVWLVIMNNIGYFVKCASQVKEVGLTIEDVVHSSLPYIVRYIKKWATTSTTLSAYIATIGRAIRTHSFTRRAVIHHDNELAYDHRSVGLFDDWMTLSPAVDEAIMQEETMDVMRSAVAGLSEQLRLVIDCCYYKGMTLRESGELLGVSHQTIDNRRREALRSLRVAMSEV